jgi:hypothetical protein
VALSKIPVDEFRAAIDSDELMSSIFVLGQKAGFNREFVDACENLARATAMGQRLPVGTLRTLVKRVGIEEFKALAVRAGPSGKGPVELSFRVRRTAPPKRVQMRNEHAALEIWGTLVLGAVERGELLSDARLSAAQLLGWHCTNAEQRRTLEHRWSELVTLCRRRNFGPRIQGLGIQYPLSALVGRRGQRPKNSRKSAADQ